MTMRIRRFTPLLMVACIALACSFVAASERAYASSNFTFEASFGTEGAGLGELKEPFNAAVDQSNGDLFVAEPGNARIQIFDASGKPAAIIDGGEVPGGFSKELVGVAVDNSSGGSSGDVYVADERNRVVDKFKPKGSSPSEGYEYVCHLVGAGGGCIREGGNAGEPFAFPTGVAVDGLGNLYVAQVGGGGAANDEVDEFDAEGNSVATFVCPDVVEGFGVAVNSTGSALYVVNLFSNTVKLTIDTTTHRVSGEEILDSEGSLAVAVDPTTGDAFVDDSTGEPHVSEFEAEAEADEGPVARFGTGEIAFSVGVAYSTLGEGKVYVTDLGRNDVRIYTRAPGQPPVVQCEPPIELRANAVTVECAVEPEEAEEVEWHVEYKRPGSSKWTATPGGILTGTGKIKEKLSIEPEKEYVYRASAINKRSETGRSARTRFTSPPALELITGLATTITATSAILAGEVNPLGVDSHSVFDYGFTSSYGSSIDAFREGGESTDDGSGNIFVKISRKLEGLEPNKTYHWRARGINAESEEGVGRDAEFTTSPAPPSVSANVSDISRKTASFSGMVNPENSATEYHFMYGTSPLYGSDTNGENAGEGFGNQAAGPVEVRGLTPGTLYHFRIAATNTAGGTEYSPDQTFVTGTPILPQVGIGEATEVTQTSATVIGTIDSARLPASYEFEVGVDTGYGGATIFGRVGEGAETVTLRLHDLAPGTTYHYRFVASNEDGTTAGPDGAFTTPGIPSPITQPLAAPLLATPSIAFPIGVGKVIKQPGKRRGNGKGKKGMHQKKSSRRKHRRTARHGKRQRGVTGR